MVLHPKYKRYLRQTLTFGFIWLAFGLVYVFIEYGLLGSLTVYPSTGNQYDFKSALLFGSIGSFITGFLQGWIEVTWLRRKFEHYPFWIKLLFKSAFYLVFVILFLVILTLITNAIRFNSSLLHPDVIDSLWQFITRFTFWSMVILIGVVLQVAFFYSEMSQYVGDGVLFNYLFGKYHKPKHEVRIFMFLDMKSSTTIAEKIGHENYFDLLKAYYADMTDAILGTSGEIYQYVGDEIVVTWSKKEGIENNNCLHCFAKISDKIKKKREIYLKSFGIVPEFKAGYHIGSVTTGEIGIIKKDIIHTGDVLNTTARIQAECNTYNVKTLISGDLLNELHIDDAFSSAKIGEILLRGKSEPIGLFSISI